MKQTEKEAVLQRTKSEIYKKINKAIDFAKKCGALEILIAVVEMHLRSVKAAENLNKEVSPENIADAISLDSIKYVIQLIIKYSEEKKANLHFEDYFESHKRYWELLSMVNEISSLNEFIPLAQLSPDIKFVRPNLVRSDLTDISEDGQKYFDYASRSDFLTNLEKTHLINSNDFISFFLDSYTPYNDLFEKSMIGETPNDIAKLYKHYFDVTSSSIKNILPKQPAETIIPDTAELRFSLLGCFCFVYTEELQKLNASSPAQSFSLFTRTIEKTDIDVYNLNYYALTRKPFINFNGILIVSPFILLESLLLNAHYSLLEDSLVKDEYKHLSSELFLDKIISIANKYGFSEKMRNFDLMDGKRCVGDLDLVLKRDDFCLIVEAKNQNLPIPVFFHDYESTEKHLERLRNDWEKHVKERTTYLASHYADVGVSSDFKYIIVSKCPEVLSHFSDVLCLNIVEFEKWLSYGDLNMDFESFYQRFYFDEQYQPTIKEMMDTQKRLNPHICFAER